MKAIPTEHRQRNVIYLIRNSDSGKSYVGQTRETVHRRWSHHRNKALAEDGSSYSAATAIARAMRKHGISAFDFSILEVCKPETLNEREAFWISSLGTLSPSGYNLTAGGNNEPRAPEIGAKISAANKGRVKSPEWLAKLSAAHMGKIISPEQRAKTSAFHTGRKQSPELIEKRAAKVRGQKRNYSPEKRAAVGAAISAGMSEEGKARSRAAHIGVKRSPDTIAKLKEAWVRRKEAA